MERAELAARLVEADEAERAALLKANNALLDTEFAYILKDICLDGWSSDPLRSLSASAVLSALSRLHSEAEIAALRDWAHAPLGTTKGSKYS